MQVNNLSGFWCVTLELMSTLGFVNIFTSVLSLPSTAAFNNFRPFLLLHFNILTASVRTFSLSF